MSDTGGADLGGASLRRPRRVVGGDRVAIVAPASPLARDEFDRGVEGLRRLGFEPTWDEAVFARNGYVAGSAEMRAESFLRAWTDPSVSALIAARGGYGSVQLLPHLDPARCQGAPKAFIGFSDTTSLLSWLTTRCGVVAFHGPMLEGRIARGEEGCDRASLFGALAPEPMGSLRPPGLRVVREGEATGPLFGGTLTALVSSLGTPFAFAPPAGAVLFLEDVNERPYRLDRMLTQLRLSGILARASALVFGELPGCDEPGGSVLALDVVKAAAASFEGPVLAGFPSGHTAGPTWTLPLGVRASVVTGARPALVIEEAATE
ncbi:MAG: LD-carboxypeptidase [Acidimicrobiia bacterium]|nr:LD-carboxypeptidase [Acidimicrobiia bacterium]